MSSKSNQPIELLKSGQLLAVTDSLSAGVILQKPYFAEFVGPGAAVGGMFDIECVTLYALGDAEFTVPATMSERQQAFRRRIEDIEMMQQLCESDVPLHRATNILKLLCDRFGTDEVRSIPNDVLAKLAGVLPGTIQMAWQQEFNVYPTVDAESDSLMFALA
jgi:hypothetical protein